MTLSMRTIAGLLVGILLGVAVGVGVAVNAAWLDPPQAPPGGGYLRAGTGTQQAGDCTASDVGRLEYNTAGTLHVCTGSGWATVGP